MPALPAAVAVDGLLVCPCAGRVIQTDSAHTAENYNARVLRPFAQGPACPDNWLWLVAFRDTDRMVMPLLGLYP